MWPFCYISQTGTHVAPTCTTFLFCYADAAPGIITGARRTFVALNVSYYTKISQIEQRNQSTAPIAELIILALPDQLGLERRERMGIIRPIHGLTHAKYSVNKSGQPPHANNFQTAKVYRFPHTNAKASARRLRTIQSSEASSVALV